MFSNRIHELGYGYLKKNICTYICNIKVIVKVRQD